MADRDRDPDPQDASSPAPTAGEPGDSMASAYSPPQRRAGLWRNPNMLVVLAAVVIALVVFVILLG